MLLGIEKSGICPMGILIGLALLVACSGAGAPATAPAAKSRSVEVEAERWYSDEEKEAVDPDGVEQWVAAWFAGENFMEESISRWWMVTPVEEDTPEALLARSVALLDDPPEGWTSAFARGIMVRDVTFDGSEVLLDLNTGSEGLYGHGSAGYVIGSEQLSSAARFYFPEARTLCVAYDGVRTTIEEGGPSFLHDANGCPIRLR